VLALLVRLVFGGAKRTPPNTSRNKSSNTQRTENKTTNVVIHQHSRKLLKMDVLMSETCWAHNKWNKMASDIKLVFHSSSVMLCRPLNFTRIDAIALWILTLWDQFRNIFKLWTVALDNSCHDVFLTGINCKMSSQLLLKFFST
jgi:transposase InsO family protein